ncbi:NAD(P)H-dependent oxidoreductase [Ottowia sp. GY511]|uniref:NADPH-dependent FMN reductase n=1 Tax=Ottowia flava TaxID=2675430 RepID=A0ABW4KY85_9BURK|nr:NAD(P)H-dependent oxidoreductase [Ottowia sp. GY511]TXK24936.1 NAD(P)H-dependent oxidoreductase [Ottowia sp. GY511]
MSQTHIAVVVGSIRKESFNRQFAEAFVKLAPADFKFSFVRIDDLPLYDQDADAAPAVPTVARLRDEIKQADGVLFVTPEYNRSIPGVLKNAIDQASRPWGKSVWAGKPTAVMGVSVGVIGTALAQQHLRNVLAYLAMPTLAGNEAFIQWKDGLVVNGEMGEQSKEFAQGIMDAFVAWVRKFPQAK